MLRLAVALLLLWPAAAWADGLPGQDIVGIVKDGGPWGLSVLFFSVITILWLRSNQKDDEIKGLNRDLITAARAAEKLVGDNALAIQRFDDAARARAEADAERWGMLKRMSEGFTDLAGIVKATAETLKRIEERVDIIERSNRRGDR